jgi:hypothetical protein
MMETKQASEILSFSSTMTRPVGRDGFSAFIRRESFNSSTFIG